MDQSDFGAPTLSGTSLPLGRGRSCGSRQQADERDKESNRPVQKPVERLRSATRRATRGEPGFSMVEMLLVVGVMSVCTTMAVFGVQSVLPSMRADAAMRQVAAQLTVARELAVGERRAVRVEFLAPNAIRTTRLVTATESTALNTVALENGMQFALFAQLPDTPSGFGRAGAVDFGSAVTMMFLPDGTFVDQAGVPLNGTAYLGMPNQLPTARAVTVFGATGRIVTYKWTGSEWVD